MTTFGLPAIECVTRACVYAHTHNSTSTVRWKAETGKLGQSSCAWQSRVHAARSAAGAVPFLLHKAPGTLRGQQLQPVRLPASPCIHSYLTERPRDPTSLSFRGQCLLAVG